MITAFLTDSTLCIGCKACEVACKEWNGVPADGFTFTGTSYDNTGALGHSTWRHVKFIERTGDVDGAVSRGEAGYRSNAFRWDFSSDVCKHCEHAGCLEACPTGSIVRTEFGGVYIQPDVCNGCGYCVVTCPFGVVDRRPDDGRAFKCTFCYDRQKVGLAAGVRDRVPDAVDPVRRAGGPAHPCRRTRRRAARARHRRCGGLRSAGQQRGRYACDLRPSRPSR